MITVTQDTTYRDLWKLIFRKHVNAIPVVDAKKKLIGLVTKDDLLESLYPDYREYLEELTTVSDFESMEGKVRDVSGKKAKEVMSKRVIYTREDTPIMRALSRMIVRRVGQLPVVTEADTLVGVVTKGDIFKALFRKQLGSKRPLVHKKKRRG